MQNAGQQYCQGGAASHQNQAANFGHSEPSNTSSNGGSTTTSLRQFRRKVEDRHQTQDNSARQIPESHVARVAPQNHYPPRTSECYRYPGQYQDYSYSLPSQVKYSEISETPQSVHQEHVPPTSVIQKAKPNKDYMEMCNPQHVVKQPYNDLHLNNQQQIYNDGTVLSQTPYIPKDAQVHHPLYKPESQYFPKEAQYQPQLQHQMPKYNMPQAQMRKFPSSENEFLSKLQQINPLVARSIMSDHHLQEPQKTYQPMDQNRMYPLHHNQRYMNHPSPIQGNHYPHAGYMPPQPFANYSSCTYSRSPQMSQPRFPSMSPHERSMSPRRTFSDGMTMSMNYPGISPKISPNYPQFNSADFAQHYQQRRPSISQDYYQQHCRPTQYMPHQMPAQEMPEGRVTVSDSIKQYIENWADEETASEMNQMETSRFNKDGLRVREDQLPETVYTINAEYLEPLVESENGIPLVTSLSIDNTSGMIRILDKNGQVDFNEPNGERIVNVHIMESTNKPDCMLATNKPNEPNQRLNSDVPLANTDKSKLVIHQNTVIQTNNVQNHDATKERDQNGSPLQQIKVGNSLPMITDDQDPMEEFQRTIIKECKKETVETVDKNCSPIHMEDMEALGEEKQEKSLPLFNEEQKVESEIIAKVSEQSQVAETTKENEENEEKTEPKDESEKISSEVEQEKDVKPKEPEEELKTIVDNPVAVEEKKEENVTVEGEEHVTKDETMLKEKSGKRSKRIFSVDDIINNIGLNIKKTKKETERRHSLPSVMEFLDTEIKNSLIFDLKEKFPANEHTSEESKDQPSLVDEVKKDDDNKTSEETNNKVQAKSEETETKSKPNGISEQKNLPEDGTESNQDLQVRNVIKVDEPNVLLHIAGEFVEINVSSINGKKVITVTPMSSSTSVDFNDNYETLDSNDVPELLKFEDTEIDERENPTEMVEVENVVPEPDCVEPSSEVVIGMDLSLEEEIKLDVEQPTICTKAAKKAYDNDLQIPSITTSEDVNNESDIYNTNDKVSSTKEKTKNSADELEKTSKTEREKLREFRKTKPPTKDDDDEEFVPFKELIKARKMKKMKMMEMKKSEEIVKADSTNKEDEIVKESDVESKNDNKSIKKEKKPSSDEDSKKHKTSSTKKSCKVDHDRNKTERSKEKHRSSGKRNKEKNKSCKTGAAVKVSSESGLSTLEQAPKNDVTDLQPVKEPQKETSNSDDNEKVATDTAENNEDQGVVRELKSQEPVQVPAGKNKTPEETDTNKSHASDSSERAKQPDIPEGKKKLSLQEYNSRKRKLLENKSVPSTKKLIFSDSAQTFIAIRSQRPKSLDDLDSIKESKPSSVILKRKHSLGSLSVPNNFDWEETQSPKSNLDVRDQRFSEFRGLISEKPNPKYVINQVEDNTLQTYKEKVESKLSSLNIQIPKSSKVSVSPDDGVLNVETSGLMERFLKNDRLTASEMDKIRKIITYKRFMQQMKKPTHTSTSKDIKVQTKRLSSGTKTKKKRFRNLYGASSSDTEDESVETRNPTSGDYSVVQSNCLAGVVPKLIIKRKQEIPVPFVKLERLDLDVLLQEKRVCIE